MMFQSNEQDTSNKPVHAPRAVDRTPLLGECERTELMNWVGDVRAQRDRLPPDAVAEVISLLATVEGHLAASPPNLVASREAVALVRDQLTRHLREEDNVREIVERSGRILDALGDRTVADDRRSGGD